MEKNNLFKWKHYQPDDPVFYEIEYPMCVHLYQLHDTGNAILL
ncbi:Protein of unknown function [Bacillus mycoides]|uniref:Uncharacterized protein n=1 Tax=Bacillus mycoides TaxID=1405 RepID=A0A1G4EG11_BACMY|nr:Protein of unknown function [Bacillus mycoides]